MADNPLSPHLQVYRPQLTSVMSITHRVTGVFLVLGSVMLLYWLVAAATGPERYAEMQRCFASTPSQLIMFGWTFAFYFHLLNGVRHLFWDSGWGLDIQSAYRSGYAAIAGALVMSVLTFACVVAQGGGA